MCEPTLPFVCLLRHSPLLCCTQAMPSYLPLNLTTSQTPATVRFRRAPASWATAPWTPCQRRCRTRGLCPSPCSWWIRAGQRGRSILRHWQIMASPAQGKVQLLLLGCCAVRRGQETLARTLHCGYPASAGGCSTGCCVGACFHKKLTVLLGETTACSHWWGLAGYFLQETGSLLKARMMLSKLMPWWETAKEQQDVINSLWVSSASHLTCSNVICKDFSNYHLLLRQTGSFLPMSFWQFPYKRSCYFSAVRICAEMMLWTGRFWVFFARCSSLIHRM